MPAQQFKKRESIAILKRIQFADRMEVERRLRAGDSAAIILKDKRFAYFKFTTWVSAVKRNAYPGGPLDPKGALAKFEGQWLDHDGVLRPWIGFEVGEVGADADGRTPRIRDVAKEKAEAEEKRRRAVAVLAFKKPVTPPEPPSARHEGMPDPDAEDNDVIPDGKTASQHKRQTVGGKHLRTARAVARRELPVSQRIMILAECAKDKAENWRTRLAAIHELNELDGLIAAAKASIGDTGGSAPLFEFARGAKGVGFMPEVPSASPKPPTDSTEEPVTRDTPPDQTPNGTAGTVIRSS